MLAPVSAPALTFVRGGVRANPRTTAPRSAARRPGRRAAAVLCAAAAVAGVALTAGPATAAPKTAGPATAVSAASGSVPVTHPEAVTAAQRQAVLAYWTPERISALTQPSSGNPEKSGPDGAAWTTANALPATVGRLFFTDHGEDASCTATVVRSANRSTVVTAGHCVNNTDLLGEDDQWAANEMFVPGYHDGLAPYGKFVGRLGVADATWLRNDAQNSLEFDGHDQAFVVVGQNAAGRLLQDAVGAAQQIGFDRPGDRPVYEFGYPRAASDPAREGLPEYTGARLAYCAGRPLEYPGTADFPEPPGEWGTACVMGGGASGGPRIAGFDPATGLGTVVGDDTQGGYFDASGGTCASDDPSSDPACTRHLVGPQFTSAITGPLYATAQHLG